MDTNRIAEMIEPSLAAMGYGLVRVAMTSGRRATLQIMIERLDDLPITLDDCKQISHSVSSLLDVADPIAGGYSLEISSPGIDRPLRSLENLRRFSGQRAAFTTIEAVEGRRHYEGEILGPEGERAGLRTDDGHEHWFDWTDLKDAHLVVDPWAESKRTGERR